jgi:hypothetical protein
MSELTALPCISLDACDARTAAKRSVEGRIRSRSYGCPIEVVMKNFVFESIECPLTCDCEDSLTTACLFRDRPTGLPNEPLEACGIELLDAGKRLTFANSFEDKARARGEFFDNGLERRGMPDDDVHAWVISVALDAPLPDQTLPWDARRDHATTVHMVI